MKLEEMVSPWRQEDFIKEVHEHSGTHIVQHILRQRYFIHWQRQIVDGPKFRPYV